MGSFSLQILAFWKNVSKYYKNGDLSLFVTVFSYLGVLKHESGC